MPESRSFPSAYAASDLECERCKKPKRLCVCEEISPLQTRIHVLLLQHPQEPDKDLGSALLTHLSLPNSSIRVGLSWPNLAAALAPPKSLAGDAAPAGSPRSTAPVPSRWAVLYLGSGVKAPAKGESATPSATPPLQFVDKRGSAAKTPPRGEDIDGLVVLDGTWSQAKALWWRNAWLLKQKRCVLIPARRSMYGELRREPRGECVSTIEAVAESLVALGEPAEVGDGLRRLFGRLLQKKRGR